MKMLLFVFVLLPNLAFANSPAKPNVDNWELVDKSNISFKTPDDEVVYLGFETIYSNPTNSRKQVLVLERFVPFILVERLPQGQGVTAQKARVLRDNNEKIKEDLFNELLEKSDTFMYVRWETSIDLRNGEDILIGDIEVWMMNQDGSWSYRTHPVSRESFSEPNKLDLDKLVSVGLRYAFEGEGVYQIIKIDQLHTAALKSKEDENDE
jgi:hypothetical protein